MPVSGVRPNHQPPINHHPLRDTPVHTPKQPVGGGEIEDRRKRLGVRGYERESKKEEGKGIDPGGDKGREKDNV